MPLRAASKAQWPASSESQGCQAMATFVLVPPIFSKVVAANISRGHAGDIGCLVLPPSLSEKDLWSSAVHLALFHEIPACPTFAFHRLLPDHGDKFHQP